MYPDHDLERCLTFVRCQLHPAKAIVPPSPAAKRWRTVTISRQAGSGGHAVAELLAGYLQSRAPDDRSWTVFDRNLVEKVLEDHHLAGRLARFMPEDRHSEIQDVVDELFGLHPPSWTLVKKTEDTILRLAELGNVIILGRGASVVTNRLEHVFHVRLIGSVEQRARHLQKALQMKEREALKFIRREDGGRRRYLRKYFHKDIDDPMLYHCVINTDRLSHEEVARLIADAVFAS